MPTTHALKLGNEQLSDIFFEVSRHTVREEYIVFREDKRKIFIVIFWHIHCWLKEVFYNKIFTLML